MLAWITDLLLKPQKKVRLENGKDMWERQFDQVIDQKFFTQQSIQQPNIDFMISLEHKSFCMIYVYNIHEHEITIYSSADPNHKLYIFLQSSEALKYINQKIIPDDDGQLELLVGRDIQGIIQSYLFLPIFLPFVFSQMEMYQIHTFFKDHLLHLYSQIKSAEQELIAYTKALQERKTFLITTTFGFLYASSQRYIFYSFEFPDCGGNGDCVSVMNLQSVDYDCKCYTSINNHKHDKIQATFLFKLVSHVRKYLEQNPV